MDGDGGSLLSFDDLDDVLDDVGGAHVGDALCLHVFVDACGWTPFLMMAWSHDAYVLYGLLRDGCCLDDRALDDG